ncbi:hypothetical protein PSI15_15275 [Xenorhabdus sp. PR6a]|uniref:hypothetical protein n=1 Tax=Xenorhabdus sp. PR6a TaxID=3025877 RepID=UPI00235834C9|nr:hypothetical protein [Xenorhabdus sp. PR6a]MDC9582908.1 hypothetical protein [Xenorhabdus sp. PR6a]
MVKEKWINAKEFFGLLLDNERLINLLRYASHLVDIARDSPCAEDEKQARIVDNLIAA